jgi:hypothetical protein
MKWLTRVPATVSDAQVAREQVNPQIMMPLSEGYRGQMLPTFRSTPTQVMHVWGLREAPLERRWPCHTLIGVTSEPMGAWLPGGAMHLALVRSWTVPPATLQQRGSCPRARP